MLLIGIPAIIWLPEWAVKQVYQGDKQHSIASGNNYAKLVDDYRKTIGQIFGGAFLLYTLFLTQRRTKAAEETLQLTHHSLNLTQRSLDVTRETQITDRFTKAITQLGQSHSDGVAVLEIRLGAIYSLERIARDSPNDHWTIMEILAAYVRQNSAALDVVQFEPRIDIQAAVTVVGRRRIVNDPANLDRYLDLGSTNLCGADLGRSEFQRAYLGGALLKHAFLGEAKLQGANLNGTDLQEAFLGSANLQGVKGITPEQIKKARSWKTASYDPGFAALLGLASNQSD